MIGAVPPEATPVTIPEEEPTVARLRSLLVHVPPDGDEVSVVVAPTQTVGLPVIADGAELTVTVADWAHDVERV